MFGAPVLLSQRRPNKTARHATGRVDKKGSSRRSGVCVAMEHQNKRPDEIADALSLIVWGLLLITGGVAAIGGRLTLNRTQREPIGLDRASGLFLSLLRKLTQPAVRRSVKLQSPSAKHHQSAVAESRRAPAYNAERHYGLNLNIHLNDLR